MLPRINSGEVLSCQEHRQSMDNDDAVLVPKAVPESSELADGDSNDEGSSGGSHAGAAGGDVDLESSMDSTGVQSEADDCELLGSSLIQSSLADKTPRWRQHDSEALATAASKGHGKESSDDEINGEEEGADDDMAAGAEVTSPTTPADGAMQFGFEEE